MPQCCHEPCYHECSKAWHQGALNPQANPDGFPSVFVGPQDFEVALTQMPQYVTPLELK